MTNAWDDMRKAKEEEFFLRKNKEALERLAEKKRNQLRLSPVTGEPMEQIVLHGVVIDRCPTSGGIWLDAGELDQLVEASKKDSEGGKGHHWLADFVKGLTGRS